eukprot:TRINITY_DN1061_c0_g1_i1.p1 TRINITY_DN1061_c0_g1~~TRINITY_DN1061_c0_g1_i1.p1  ORF type:complete len:388 (-),score=100.61 TRINITY_DN1061_c0_g1_i1:270-1391(-)
MAAQAIPGSVFAGRRVTLPTAGPQSPAKESTLSIRAMCPPAHDSGKEQLKLESNAPVALAAGSLAFASSFASACLGSDPVLAATIGAAADVAVADSPMDGSALTLALASGGAIAALATALSITDPNKRREKQVAEVGGNEKDAVRNYFNTSGFERWRRIYGEGDDVNKVQLDIRIGHAQTVEKVMAWLKAEGSLAGISVCDAGCGTGSLSIPLALEGARVSASDISSAMVEEAGRRAGAALAAADAEGKGGGMLPAFEARDLESITGSYHTVCCLDVLIHYPQEKAGAMLTHLASLAESRLIVSFAPYTPFYALLKRVGELFPGPSKATRAYLHAERDIEAALNAVGWKVVKREMTATQFYFSRLLEAVPATL